MLKPTPAELQGSGAEKVEARRAASIARTRDSLLAVRRYLPQARTLTPKQMDDTTRTLYEALDEDLGRLKNYRTRPEMLAVSEAVRSLRTAVGGIGPVLFLVERTAELPAAQMLYQQILTRSLKACELFCDELERLLDELH